MPTDCTDCAYIRQWPERFCAQVARTTASNNGLEQSLTDSKTFPNLSNWSSIFDANRRIQSHLRRSCLRSSALARKRDFKISHKQLRQLEILLELMLTIVEIRWNLLKIPIELHHHSLQSFPIGSIQCKLQTLKFERTERSNGDNKSKFYSIDQKLLESDTFRLAPVATFECLDQALFNALVTPRSIGIRRRWRSTMNDLLWIYRIFFLPNGAVHANKTKKPSSTTSIAKQSDIAFSPKFGVTTRFLRSGEIEKFKS